jgi:transposase InsO family protein
VKEVRSALEAEAAQPRTLSYIGAHAIRSRVKQEGIEPLPSRSSIERILSAEKMTHSHQVSTIKVFYPHLHPIRPHQLTQVDIVPRFLPGGGCVSCFNAIDVVSRYPAGMQSLSKRSQDAARFLLHVFAELGIAEYTQIDNESCFSGGMTHPGVIGKVARTLLYVGSQPVFSPFYLPESNAMVERFHQDYLKNTWDKQEMADLVQVQANSAPFFELYRLSRHHSALQGAAPADLHRASPSLRLPAAIQLPKQVPITVGKLHFIRIVQADDTINVANLIWKVPAGKVNQGVWATVEITRKGATLRVYDFAPDASHRTCLIEYPFPLPEPAQPVRKEFIRSIPVTFSWWRLAASLLRSSVQQTLSVWLSTMF